MRWMHKTQGRPTIGSRRRLLPFVLESAGKIADPSWKYGWPERGNATLQEISVSYPARLVPEVAWYKDTEMKLILASSSPRRAEILRDAGIPFEIRAAQVDEAELPDETARAMVTRLAEAKARAVAAQIDPTTRDCFIVGADTTVELDGEILGKPRDAAHAREMLAKLAGRTHHVLTGIFLLRLPGNATRATVEKSAVTFAPLSEKEVDAYVATGEPLGKAGAYAIQGLAGRFIPGIEGCYFNVVGLPLARLYALLRELGWQENE
jgi:septum formation protein